MPDLILWVTFLILLVICAGMGLFYVLLAMLIVADIRRSRARKRAALRRAELLPGLECPFCRSKYGSEAAQAAQRHHERAREAAAKEAKGTRRARGAFVDFFPVDFFVRCPMCDQLAIYSSEIELLRKPSEAELSRRFKPDEPKPFEAGGVRT